MGGNAFPRLSTPRMPPTVYQHVKTQLLTTLRSHFKHADTPIEGPAKTDHGDIDILVCGALDEKVAGDAEVLARIVGAKEWKRLGNGGAINFAVVWAEEGDVEEAIDSIKIDDLSQDSKSLRNSPDSSSISIEPSTNTLNAKLDSDSSLPTRNPTQLQRYIQLDLTIISTYKSYSWQLFHHSHSDLWPILGSLLRRYGLSARPTGFYINIPEIEGINRSLSLVKITEEPEEVLAYLGLDERWYWKQGGFESWDELCAYVGSMRFADLGRWKRKEEHKRLEREENVKVKAGETVMTESAADEDPSGSSLIIPNDDNGTSSASITTLPSRTPTPLPVLGQQARNHKDTSQDDDTTGGLNNNDRRRLNSRPLFSYYHSTYVSSHSSLNTPPGRSAHLSKLEVVDDIKLFFGQDFARRYDEARSKGIKEVLEVKFWVDVKNLIKGEGATGAELGYGVKGVRTMMRDGFEDAWAWVDDEEEMGSISPRPNPNPHLATTETTSLRHARAAFRDLKYDEVMIWVKENWRRAGEIRREVDEAKSAVKMREKLRVEKDRR